MSAVTRDPGTGAPTDEARLDVLLRAVAGNRFLPLPPVHRRGSGDGDFLAIGCEFLGHLVRLCGLDTHHGVIEIGCGIGRIALPLTQYLDTQRGHYLGIDVAEDGIHWCHETISTVYPRFRFRHVDLHHPLYNPRGALPATAARVPAEDASADRVLMISVVTHLMPEEVLANAREAARLLAPGGICLVSAFLIDTGREARLRAGGPTRPRFDLDAGPSPYFADPAHPCAAVAYDAAHLLELFAAAGLRLCAPPVQGHWAGGEGVPFQDLLRLSVRPGGSR